MNRQQEKPIAPEYEILLYYKYLALAEPQKFVDQQRELCQRLNLKGRILISYEGINGTVEGKKADTAEYQKVMLADERFTDIHFKKSIGTGSAFPRLSVKLRKEIVSTHLNEQDIDPTQTTGKRLSPDELRSWYEQGKEFTIVDMRNDYEQEVGHFRGSVFSGMQNFRDLPKTAEKLRAEGAAEAKPILTVCTGGIRCEKASGYLVKNGFQDVYQLDGGIVTYMEKYPGKDFLGSLYVFDGRVTMTFDAPEQHVVVGKCALCLAPCERYIDCKDDICHFQFICCTNCSDDEGKSLCQKCLKML